MVLAAWFPSELTLQSHHERALSQVGTHPDMTLIDAKDVKFQQPTKAPEKLGLYRFDHRVQLVVT